MISQGTLVQINSKTPNSAGQKQTFSKVIIEHLSTEHLIDKLKQTNLEYIRIWYSQ